MMSAFDYKAVDSSRLDRTVSYAKGALRELVFLLVVVAWLGLWLNVARVHLRMGHTLDASFTLFAVALPAVLLYAIHLLSVVDSAPDPSSFVPTRTVG